MYHLTASPTPEQKQAVFNELIARGYFPVPIVGEEPAAKEIWEQFRDASVTWNVPSNENLALGFSLLADRRVTGVGVLTGHSGLVAVDNDIPDPNAAMTFNATASIPGPTRIGKKPGGAKFLRSTTKPPREGIGSVRNPRTPGVEAKSAIQLLGVGKMLAVFGPHPDGGFYGFDTPDALPPRLDALHTCDGAALTDLCVKAVRVAGFLDSGDVTDASRARVVLDPAKITAADWIDGAGLVRDAKIDINSSAVGSGRGTKARTAGSKVGAMVKAYADAHPKARELADLAAATATAGWPYVDVAPIAAVDQSAFQHIEAIYQAYLELPGPMDNGSKGRDARSNFLRGVCQSAGERQQAAASERERIVAATQQQAHVFQQLGFSAAAVASGPAVAAGRRERSRIGRHLHDLMSRPRVPHKYRINRYLKDGGTIAFVGKPKIGKGFVVYDMALSIAEGGTFWGEQCQKCDVLLYMMEDPEDRIQERINLLRPNGLKPGHGHFITRCRDDGPLVVNADGSGGLLDDIRTHVAEYPGIKFVVIDMWKKIRGSTGDRTLDAYQADSKIAAPLVTLAGELGLTIILVHHMKKGKTDSIGDSGSGSLGLPGETDGSWYADKKLDGTLEIVTELRDIEDFEVRLAKKGDSPMWDILGDGEMTSGSKAGSQPDKVMNVLNAARCELTPSDIALRTGLDAVGAVPTVLRRLKEKGVIQVVRRGLYGCAGARLRHEGLIEAVLRSTAMQVATDEACALHDPEGKLCRRDSAAAKHFAFERDVVAAIENARFADAKDALKQLRERKLVSGKDGVVWFFGKEWDRKGDGNFTNPANATPAAFTPPDVGPETDPLVLKQRATAAAVVDFGALMPPAPANDVVDFAALLKGAANG